MRVRLCVARTNHPIFSDTHTHTHIQVSSVYSDPSIGNAINIVVVDIVHTGTLVSPSKSSVIPGISAPAMLAQFCSFVQRNTRRQHDVALLLTR